MDGLNIWRRLVFRLLELEAELEGTSGWLVGGAIQDLLSSWRLLRGPVLHLIERREVKMVFRRFL